MGRGVCSLERPSVYPFQAMFAGLAMMYIFFLDPPGLVTYILLNEEEILLPCLYLASNSCLSNFFIFLLSFSRRLKVINDLFYSCRVVICRAPFRLLRRSRILGCHSVNGCRFAWGHSGLGSLPRFEFEDPSLCHPQALFVFQSSLLQSIAFFFHLESFSTKAEAKFGSRGSPNGSYRQSESAT